MDFETTITKDKEHFLLKERLWFPSMTDAEYKEHMTEDAKSCKKCGVWYWNYCSKRCECN